MTESLSGEQLWQCIRGEVGAAIAGEPVLTDFLTASILNHPGLEQALGHILAQQVGNGVVTPAAVSQLYADAIAADPTIAANMRRDLLAYFERDAACDQYSMPLLYFKGFHALQIYRVGHWLWRNNRQDLARYLQSRVSDIFDVDIHPGARIGGGIMIDHATGMVIGETAVVDDDVSMLHSVTLGGTGRETGDRHPKIRRGVLVAAGAKILGNIEIGEGAKVGAGSLVLDPVPAHTTVAGVPAKIVGVPNVDAPALDMDQHLSNNGEGE